MTIKQAELISYALSELKTLKHNRDNIENAVKFEINNYLHTSYMDKPLLYHRQSKRYKKALFETKEKIEEMSKRIIELKTFIEQQ